MGVSSLTLQSPEEKVGGGGGEGGGGRRLERAARQSQYCIKSLSVLHQLSISDHLPPLPSLLIPTHSYLPQPTDMTPPY